MLNLYVIGCGGIGGFLVERLPMALSSLSLDVLESCGTDITPYLENAGNVALPCIADSIVLIDGDVFDARNALRQGAGAGGKLVQRLRWLRDAVGRALEDAAKVSAAKELAAEAEDVLRRLSGAGVASAGEAAARLADSAGLTKEACDRLDREMLRVSFLQNLKLVGWNTYLKPDNITSIIPEHPEVNAANAEARQLYAGLPRLSSETAVVFLCVDNVQTRYEVSRYMERFRDCLLVNGGNSKTSGHVTVYERRGGEPLDPTLYEVYPDIRPGVDKRPDEEECTLVAPKHDQIAVTNSIVADVMMSRFIKWVRTGLTDKSKGRDVRYNDILLDIERPSFVPLYHPLSK